MRSGTLPRGRSLAQKCSHEFLAGRLTGLGGGHDPGRIAAGDRDC